MVWDRLTGYFLRGAPVAYKKQISVMTILNQLLTFKSDDDRVQWIHRSVPEKMQFIGASIPAMHQDGLVVAYGSGEIVKLSLQTGSVLWRQALLPSFVLTEVAKTPHIVASPVIAGNTVYVVTPFSKTVALNAWTGDIVWEASVGGYQTPVVSSNFVFLVSGSDFCVLDRATGKEVARYSLVFKKRGLKLYGWGRFSSISVLFFEPRRPRYILGSCAKCT